MSFIVYLNVCVVHILGFEHSVVAVPKHYCQWRSIINDNIQT